eukprot:scaffold159497_cov18-Tisochrysis_lutea.AAC.1
MEASPVWLLSFNPFLSRTQALSVDLPHSWAILPHRQIVAWYWRNMSRQVTDLGGDVARFIS